MEMVNLDDFQWGKPDICWFFIFVCYMSRFKTPSSGSGEFSGDRFSEPWRQSYKCYSCFFHGFCKKPRMFIWSETFTGSICDLVVILIPWIFNSQISVPGEPKPEPYISKSQNPEIWSHGRNCCSLGLFSSSKEKVMWFYSFSQPEARYGCIKFKLFWSN